MSKIIRPWAYLGIILVISVLSFLIFFIAKEGLQVISLDFLTTSPKGLPFGSEGGIAPAILGTLLTTLISTLTASFFALCTAIFSVFYVKNPKLNDIICTIIQCLSGIPSILIGLFGYSFLVIFLGFGKSVISSSLALAIMIFPYIEIRIEKTFKEFNKSYILSSYALGVSTEHTIMKLVLKKSKRDIISSITIASSFAMGATAPIMLTGAVINAPSPDSLLDTFMSLPYHLYILLQNGISINEAYGTAFVLLLLVFLINLLGLLIGGKKID